MKLPSFFHQDMNQWRAGLTKTVWALGEHALLVTLVFVMIAAGIAGLLFYQYVVFFPGGASQAAPSEFAFRKALFFELLGALDRQADELGSADALQTRDIFNP